MHFLIIYAGSYILSVNFNFVNLRVGEMDNRKEEGRVRGKPFFIRVCIARNCARLCKYLKLVVLILGYVSEAPGNFV